MRHRYADLTLKKQVEIWQTEPVLPMTHQSHKALKMSPKPLLIVLIFLAVAATLVPLLGWTWSEDESQGYMTHTIRRGNLSVTVTENGMLESSNNEEIKCMVKGGSTVLWVIETGTFVKSGDELVRLDTSLIEDNITQQKISYERAVANQIIAQSEVDVATTNIEEYINGTYVEERNTLEKQIFDAEEQVKKSQLAFESSERMASKGMLRTLQLEGQRFATESAQKDLDLKRKQLETLDKYKRTKKLQELESSLEAAKARLAAEDASLKLEKDRLDRDEQQLENCVIRAKSEGMVIFPSAAEWKETPDIEEGAVVREQQTLLMIPDLSKMQVKVGVHESKVARLNVGMRAEVELQDSDLVGEVAEIAEVTRPAGWWTGNMVKYDTIIELPNENGLKPGMSAVVDIILADHKDVLQIPVAAIVETGKGFVCWVESESGVVKRAIKLGDTNDEYTIVTDGIQEGDKVILDPTAFIESARAEAMKPTENDRMNAESEVGDNSKSDDGSKPKGPSADGQTEEAAES